MHSTDEATPATYVASGDGQLPPLLKSFQLWTVLFFGFSCCFHAFFYFVMHDHGHLGNPMALNRHDTFYDFTIFIDKFKSFHTAKFFEVGFPINYPAPVCLCFEAFFKYGGPHPTRVFVAFSTLAYLVPAGMFAWALVRRGVSAGRAWLFCGLICVMSWPALLIVDGGNAEVFVWLAMLVAMWAYATGRLWTAAAFFGVAASMKLFPFVFLALFLTRKRFQYLLFGAATFLVVSVVSLWVLGPTIAIAYRGIAFGLASFHDNYMAHWRTGENGVDHSLFAFIKLVLIATIHHNYNGFPNWLRAYLLITSVGGTALYFLRIRYMPLLNQVLALSVSCIYLTAFSGDGTLIHLYYPLGMLFLLSLKAWRDGVAIPGLATLMYTMVFCVSMESFLVLSNHGGGFRLIGPAHSVGLGMMLIASLYYPMGPPLAEERGEIVLSEPVTDWVRGTAAA